MQTTTIGLSEALAAFVKDQRDRVCVRSLYGNMLACHVYPYALWSATGHHPGRLVWVHDHIVTSVDASDRVKKESACLHEVSVFAASGITMSAFSRCLHGLACEREGRVT